MRFIIMIVMLVFLAQSVWADRGIVKLKNGKKYVGEIVNVSNKKITIKTSKMTRSYPWRVLHKDTIRVYNPAMYADIKAKEKAEMDKKIAAKGYVKYKNSWVSPKRKLALEKIDMGLEFFEEKWMPTNEVKKIKFQREMKSKNMVEYKGKWFTPQELEEYKTAQINKGIKTGMSQSEVIAKWGKPSKKIVSEEFKIRQRVMWIFVDEEKQIEDRAIFEMGKVRQIQTNKEISDFE